MVERGPFRSAQPRASLADRLAQERYRHARARFLGNRQSVELLTVALFFWELFAPGAWCAAQMWSARFVTSTAAFRWTMAETVLVALVPLVGFVALARRLGPRGLVSTAARVTAIIAALIGAAECILVWCASR